MTNASTSQVNARIDASLKQRGDKALADAGFTPTHAIRSLWELAVRYTDEPGKLASVLEPDAASDVQRARTQHRRAVAKAINAGESLMREAFEEAGVPWPAEADGRTYGQLREDAYDEARVEGRGEADGLPC